MTYKLLPEGVQRLSDGAHIPPDDDNTDWRDYVNWVLAGNHAAPADPPPPPSPPPPARRARLLESVDSITNLTQAKALLRALVQQVSLPDSRD